MNALFINLLLLVLFNFVFPLYFWVWNNDNIQVNLYICHCLHDLRLSTHTQATLILMSLQATRFLKEVNALTNVCELVQYEFQWRTSIPRHPEPPVLAPLHTVSKKYCFFLTSFMLTSGSTVTSLPEMSVAFVLLPTQKLTLSHTEYTPRLCGCPARLFVLSFDPWCSAGSESGGCSLKSTRGDR